MQSLLIFGRQPELGLAELESLYGIDKIQLVSSIAACLDVDPCLVNFDRLGGSIKFCKVLARLNVTSWKEVIEYLIQNSPTHAQNVTKGKLTIGLNDYGFNNDFKEIIKSAVLIKSAIAKTGRSVRVVPNKSNQLNTAQIIHNKLLSEKGWDINIIKANKTVIIAQTIKVQDIDKYKKRDFDRPYRDARVGMLPPKLAQILINLASGLLPDNQRQSICDFPANQIVLKKPIDKTILDPFCGSGVILQEALLMGYKVIGSDIDKRMVNYSQKNLQWLEKSYINSKEYSIFPYDVFVADALTHKWQNIDFIVSELLLGTPFNQSPSSDQLNKNVEKINKLLYDFLINLKQQINNKQRICLAVPVWKKDKKFVKLPIIDQITSLGYNFVSLKSANELIYMRPNQFVGRQIILLEKNK